MLKRLLSLALAITLCSTVLAAPRLEKRDVNSIPGKDFTEEGGVRAAAAAAPVWLFGRQEINGNEPCYPEQATNAKEDGPNPGTDDPLGPNPGEDCRDPGPANGLFSPGASFPSYIETSYCGDTWRITYSIYFVHDGAGSQGHKHDWESATVMFKRDEGGQDMWHRDGLILSQHEEKAKKGWGEIQTVNMDGDLKDTNGQYRAHPKVYVGFFKHAMFFEKKTAITVYSAVSQQDEYRSDDWFFMGRQEKGDFRLGSTLDKFYNEDKDAWGTTSSPPAIRNDICSW